MFVPLALVPQGDTTSTSTAVPAALLFVGTVTVIVWSFVTVRLVPATPPKVTLVAPLKQLPEIVTTVPEVPLDGLTLAIVGIGLAPV